MRGEVVHGARGGVGLGRADVLHAVRDLALQVGQLDDVVVDDHELADAGRGEGEERGGTEPTRPHDGDPRRGEATLPLLADPREDGVARGAHELFGGERRHGRDERLHPLSVGVAVGSADAERKSRKPP